MFSFVSLSFFKFFIVNEIKIDLFGIGEPMHQKGTFNGELQFAWTETNSLHIRWNTVKMWQKEWIKVSLAKGKHTQLELVVLCISHCIQFLCEDRTQNRKRMWIDSFFLCFVKIRMFLEKSKSSPHFQYCK